MADIVTDTDSMVEMKWAIVIIDDGRELYGTNCFTKKAMEKYVKDHGGHGGFYEVKKIPVTDQDRICRRYVPAK